MNYSTFSNNFFNNKNKNRYLEESFGNITFSFIKIGDKTMEDLDLDGVREKL